ncbi:UDP-3-O-acyl-N-acetylglucosamine deacetylase [Hyphococcus sp.]|uniref:UDP-3-O-acyl-N-acetylglucosamine deacetylase n=1 Tax=Hyphococcus sp. TaxID=2038636 RepID=UPI003D0ABEB4
MRNAAFQRTLKTVVEFAGVGLHSGEACRVVLHPAGTDEGIRFVRADLPSPDNVIAAIPENVACANHGTTLTNEAGASVATVEHLMAALALTGVDNVTATVTGPELPILDGSAAPFVSAIAEAGLQKLAGRREPIVIADPERISDRGRSITVEPFAGRIVEVDIDFGDCLIGRQSLTLDLDDSSVIARLASARTFCRLNEVEALRAAGLIRGGALSNGIVVDGDRLLNEEPLRDACEFALHKALDLIGDLYLLGRPLVGRIKAVKPGHDLNTRAALYLKEAQEAVGQPARAATA